MRSPDRLSALPPLEPGAREQGTRQGRAGLSRQSPQPPDARRPRHGRGDGDRARPAAGGCDLHERRRQLLGLGAPLLRVQGLPDPARADERCDGLRRARGGCRQAAPSRARRGRDRGRRRLPDDRAGARDGGAVRRSDRRAHRQQRHVRDDSHAPGAALPRPRLGHRPRQSRLRRAGAGVRRARSGGRAHRGLRRCLRRGARRRTARGDRASRRPGGADAAAVADRDPRAGDRPALEHRRITYRLRPRPEKELFRWQSPTQAR